MDELEQQQRDQRGEVDHPDARQDLADGGQDRLGDVEQDADQGMVRPQVEPGEQRANQNRDPQYLEQPVDEVDQERGDVYGRAPNSARPTRTIVAPSAMASG